MATKSELTTGHIRIPHSVLAGGLLNTDPSVVKLYMYLHHFAWATGPMRGSIVTDVKGLAVQVDLSWHTVDAGLAVLQRLKLIRREDAGKSGGKDLHKITVTHYGGTEPDDSDDTSEQSAQSLRQEVQDLRKAVASIASTVATIATAVAVDATASLASHEPKKDVTKDITPPTPPEGGEEPAVAEAGGDLTLDGNGGGGKPRETLTVLALVESFRQKHCPQHRNSIEDYIKRWLAKGYTLKDIRDYIVEAEDGATIVEHDRRFLDPKRTLARNIDANMKAANAERTQHKFKRPETREEIVADCEAAIVEYRTIVDDASASDIVRKSAENNINRLREKIAAAQGATLTTGATK